MRLLDRADLSQSGVEERRGGHDQHRHVDQPRQAHGDEDIDQLIAEELALLLRMAS